MPKQVGPHFVTGSLEGFSFYQRQGHYLVRRKGGPSRQRVLHAPAFAGTRAHLSEFGYCSAFGKRLRRALGAWCRLPDRQLYRRLTRRLWQVLQCDILRGRGERTVTGGLCQPAGRALLRDFAFYPGAPGQTAFVDAVRQLPGGDLRVDASRLRWPAGASHVQLRMLYLSAQEPLHVAGQRAYGPLRWQRRRHKRFFRVGAAHRALPHTGDVAPGLLFMQLCFFEEVGSQLQSFAGGAYDSLQAVGVEQVAAPQLTRRFVFEDRLTQPDLLCCKRTLRSAVRYQPLMRVGGQLIRAG